MSVVALPIPPSVNAIWRAVRNAHTGQQMILRSRSYKRWLEPAVLVLRMGLPKPALPCRVLIVVRGGKGWKAGRDLDNVAKPVLDAIRHAERIPDDSWECVAEVRVRYEPPTPGVPARCEVAFFEVDT